jgi:predicted RecB family nuclease
MLRLTASDFYTVFRPSKCENRVYLRQKGLEEGLPSPYDEVIRKLGARHEQAHLSLFPEIIDLSSGSREDRERCTKEEVGKKTPAIYHGVLRTIHTFGSTECEVLGEPDFLILEGDNYLIRDSKVSRRINEKEHPEVILQLGLYGWLYQKVFGREPAGLQIHAGTGEIVSIPYDNGAWALKLLGRIFDFKNAELESYSPVGWTKCGGCPFHDRCWLKAKEEEDVALVYGVDQGLATELNRLGFTTFHALLSGLDEDRLANLKRPFGNATRKVGKAATSILRMAKATASGHEIMIARPQIPDFPNYVMFDLEGLPPHLDEIDKIYLWGLQVFGERPGNYKPALAGFGEEGDREGWKAFLQASQNIFVEYGDIPFVHWHHYERVRIEMYADRYGDPEGIAARVERNLLDLLPIARDSIALPLPSYSLKVVERYIGFGRTQDEYGGDWSMAKYIEATELEDPAERAKVMEEILTYNREDLEATWAVLKWLKSKAA